MSRQFKIPFSYRIFISVMSIFVVFAACFIIYQHHRELVYKTDSLNDRLQDYNALIAQVVDSNRVDKQRLDRFLHYHKTKELRITIITDRGDVLFDNRADSAEWTNHLSRPEVHRALRHKQGFDLRRFSHTTGLEYFYVATYFPEIHLIVRSALPYDDNLMQILQADSNYLWFTLVLTLLLVGLYFFFTQRIGKSIKQLRQFAKKMEAEEIPDPDSLNFPHNELGDISRNIVHLYAQLQSSRRDKDRLKRQLTQNIAHELKTPVASIQGYLETIVKTPDIDMDTCRMFLQRCYAQSCRLTNLVRDISALNSLDDTHDNYERATINLLELVKGVQQDVHLQLEEKQMKMMLHISPEVTINGNSGLIYSIFRNLTDNAIFYAGQSKVITIECEPQDADWYVIRFSDNGNGVSPEHLPHLFERFYRADKGRSRKLGGTGLGLAIVKNAVLYHGGQIQVENETAGGLLFTFTLPKDHTPLQPENNDEEEDDED